MIRTLYPHKTIRAVTILSIVTAHMEEHTSGINAWMGIIFTVESHQAPPDSNYP